MTESLWQLCSGHPESRFVLPASVDDTEADWAEVPSVDPTDAR
jgi:hypothetical protein